MKQTDFRKWQDNLKQGGLTAHSKAEMDIIMLKFVENVFGAELLNGKVDKMQFVHSMMPIIFSHRYSKGDRFITEAEKDQNVENPVVDFSIIRDVMYKYSRKSQDRFFSYPVESFLFAAFSLSDEGILFLKSKPDNKVDEDKLHRLHDDLAKLKNQAVMSL